MWVVSIIDIDTISIISMNWSKLLNWVLTVIVLKLLKLVKQLILLTFFKLSHRYFVIYIKITSISAGCACLPLSAQLMAVLADDLHKVAHADHVAVTTRIHDLYVRSSRVSPGQSRFRARCPIVPNRMGTFGMHLCHSLQKAAPVGTVVITCDFTVSSIV